MPIDLPPPLVFFAAAALRFLRLAVRLAFAAFRRFAAARWRLVRFFFVAARRFRWSSAACAACAPARRGAGAAPGRWIWRPAFARLGSCAAPGRERGPGRDPGRRLGAASPAAARPLRPVPASSGTPTQSAIVSAAMATLRRRRLFPSRIMPRSAPRPSPGDGPGYGRTHESRRRAVRPGTGTAVCLHGGEWTPTRPDPHRPTIPLPVAWPAPSTTRGSTSSASRASTRTRRQSVWNEIAQFLWIRMGRPKRVLDPAGGRGEFVNAVPGRGAVARRRRRLSRAADGSAGAHRDRRPVRHRPPGPLLRRRVRVEPARALPLARGGRRVPRTHARRRWRPAACSR